MHYVYIIQSAKDLSFYIGVTSDLKRRFKEHNSGNCEFTSTRMPYALKWYGAFESNELARDFEKYLKSSSGFAFRNKHLINK